MKLALTPTLFRPSSRGYGSVPAVDFAPPRGEAGAEGDHWLNDLFGGGPDVNPELTGAGKWPVYDEMAKTDPSIKSVLLFYGLPVRSAAWGLNPAEYGRPSTDPTATLIRDMVAWNVGLEGQLGELDLSWDELNQQALKQLQNGHVFEELVWDFDKGKPLRVWRDADGDEHPVVPLAKLAVRPPSTIEKVERAKNGRIDKVLQNVPGTEPIPGSKISYMVLEREGARWDGVSILRPAWGAWRLKKALMISAGIGWDRFAMGLPVVWHPDTPDGEAKARAIGRNARSHERGYVHFPVPQGGTKADSEWLLEILNAAQTLADPTPLLKWCSEQESEAGLQQFTKLGMTDTGSRAVGDVQVEPFYLAVQVLASSIARERTRQVIREIVLQNFGRQASERYCPTLTVSKVQARNIDTISRAMALLSPLGFVFTDAQAQEDIRELLGFGQLPNDLEAHGIDRGQLTAALDSLGLDPQTLAEIVNALPPDVGVARNRVPTDGAPLALPRAAVPAA